MSRDPCSSRKPWDDENDYNVGRRGGVLSSWAGYLGHCQYMREQAAKRQADQKLEREQQEQRLAIEAARRKEQRGRKSRLVPSSPVPAGRSGSANIVTIPTAWRSTARSLLFGGACVGVIYGAATGLHGGELLITAAVGAVLGWLVIPVVRIALWILKWAIIIGVPLVILIAVVR